MTQLQQVQVFHKNFLFYFMLICVVFLSFNEEVKFQTLSLTKRSFYLKMNPKYCCLNREEMYVSLLLVSQNVVPSPSSSRLKLVPSPFKISSDCI